MQNNEPQESAFNDHLIRFLHKLKQQILCPQILLFQRQSYQYLHEHINQQTARIKQFIKYQQQQENHEKNQKQNIYTNQIEKVSYLLKKYIRVRLQKIEKYVFYLVKNQIAASKKLSEHQFKFMKSYAEIKYKYLHENALKHLMRAYRGLGGLEVYFSKGNEIKLQLQTKQSQIQIVEPNTNQYVFAKIISNPDLSLRFNYDIQAENVEGEQIIPALTTVFTPYKNISGMLTEENVELI